MGAEASRTRRSFLNTLTIAGSAVIGLALAIPGVAYVVDPLVRGGGKKARWIRIAKLDAVGDEHPVAVPVLGEQLDGWTRQPNVRLGMVWLRKKGDKVVALTAECPHLGCKVGYDDAKKRFGCPCHDSAFTLDGDSTGGPAPRGMDPLEVRVTDDHIEVRFARFRAQVKERVEVG
jgi:menaquinol-cytochrome c reductase iron-sulfur subunit